MPETPGQQLKAEQGKLKQNQDKITGLQQQNTGIQARIKVLETYPGLATRELASLP
jgi:hypothetical protein